MLSQSIFLISFFWLSWLLMMLVHESGHALGAIMTGGKIQRVVWSPLTISRTDVFPNPHPLVEVWCGPVVGCVLPMLLAFLAELGWSRYSYLSWTFASICLISNGAYLGVGAVNPVGDAKQLLALGAARWILFVVGWTGFGIGLFTLHRTSERIKNANSGTRLVITLLAITVTIAAAL